MTAVRAQRVRRTCALLAAVAVVAAGAGACARSQRTDDRSAAPPAPGATTTGTSGPTPTTTATPGPAATRSALGVPRTVDLSWTGTSTGVALVTVRCGAGTCGHLLRTTDGGRTWADVHASGLPSGCTTACPLRVRFADAKVGYVLGDGLRTTDDGGVTWRREPGPDTQGLEISDGTVLRVVTGSACPGCAFTVQRAAVGSSTWTDLYRSQELVTAADLVRQGAHVAVDLRRNPAGGAGDAHSTLLVSGDGGTTWARHPDPCGGTRDDERDAAQLTWSQDGALVVLCSRRETHVGGGNTSVVVSRDGGRTFGPPTGFTATSTAGGRDASLDATQVAAGRGVLLAAAPGTRAVLLLRSTDAGRTWQEVARAPLPDGTTQGFLAFSSSTIASWAPPGSGRVWRSTDAGRTWPSYPLG